MTFTADIKAYRKTAKVHKALSNERRLMLLTFLATRDNPVIYSVVDLTERFKISYKLVSRHLQILDQADLIERTRIGQSIGYRVTNRGKDFLSVSL